MKKRVILTKLSLTLSVSILLIGGCSHYTTPGKGARMSIFSDDAQLSKLIATPGSDYKMPPEATDIEIKHRQPLANFPANIVFVRVQETGYESYTNKGVGTGAFSVVFYRDIEKEEDWDRLNRLVDVAQIGPLSKLLIPASLQSEKDLRAAAARLNADMLLVYTIDTDFMNRDTSAGLTVISLGLWSTINVRVTSTVSALLLDTRSGYTYGVIEETAVEEKNTAALSTKKAMDNMRLDVERKAFEQFVDEFELLWKEVAPRYRK